MALIDLIFPPRILYIKVMRNKLEVRHVNEGRTVSRNATTPFSNDRLLIADFEQAEDLFREIYIELFGKRFLNKSHKSLIQQVDKDINEVTSIEHRVYLDFAVQGGAKIAKVYETQEELSDERIIEILDDKNL